MYSRKNWSEVIPCQRKPKNNIYRLFLLLLRRLTTIHQDLAHIRPPCPTDIPPNRGELKGGKADEHNNFAPFLLAGIIVYVSCFIFPLFVSAQASDFTSEWPADITRVWVGPEYWANRLQDWRIANGRLECTAGQPDKPMRTVHLLTHRLSERKSAFTMSVRVGLIEGNAGESPVSDAGLLIGAGNELDYRGAALAHHNLGEDGDIFAGMSGVGMPLFSESPNTLLETAVPRQGSIEPVPEECIITVKIEPAGDTFDLMIEIRSTTTGDIIEQLTRRGISPEKLTGNVALVSHPGGEKSSARFWFRDWNVSGEKFDVHSDRLCGPIICTQYTLSRGIMKMTAQMMPVSIDDRQTVLLRIQKNGVWETVDAATIIRPGYTAPFRVAGWDSGVDTPYRVLYGLKQPDGSYKEYTWSGTVRRDPVDKSPIVVAAFTGNHNLAHPGVERGIPWTPDGVWFPHNDIVRNVSAHKPDVLFFSGDNVYEGNSPTRAVKKPESEARLDYLYKWYLWCWAYRDLARDIPSVTIPDDHDIYQGNIWGAGGRKTDVDNKGGYVMPADWVRMVERTQTSHLPDPYDPTPVEQGIGVYYCAMNYGRIGFAIIEDRKFKSGCNGLVPPTTSGRPDHVIDPDFDPRTADVLGAKLLGDRQLSFLSEWASDWSGVDMKAALSQTVFAGMATHHGSNLMYLVVDYDANGWPQSGRNKALHELRRGFAFMIGGDQHLATIVHHGVDDFNDAGWSFAVPSIANFYPRSWNPQKSGRNRQPGMPDYTGEYLDGLGNHVTVWAATNPGRKTGVRPAILHDKMPGYGIVRFGKSGRTITMECWPRYVDPNDPGTGRQYDGWPKTIGMEDNYSRKAVAYLPTLRFSGMKNPVVQIIDESDGEIVYTLRIKGDEYRPKVFKEGSYTVRAGEPDTERMKMIEHVRSVEGGEEKTVEIRF